MPVSLVQTALDYCAPQAQFNTGCLLPVPVAQNNRGTVGQKILEASYVISVAKVCVLLLESMRVCVCVCVHVCVWVFRLEI